MAALWSWHSAEEAEHRATCFDIHAQLGRSYLERVSLLPVSWVLILSITMRNLVEPMIAQWQKGNARDITNPEPSADFFLKYTL